MSESETIATTSTKLVKSEISINNKLRELKESNPKAPEIKELEKELAIIKEDHEVLEKRIENTVYEIVEDNDVIVISLASDFIIIQGLLLVSDVELEKIANFLSYKHYDLQIHLSGLIIYFYNNREVFDVGL
jgi:glutamate synthase domain-containing protein 1